MTEQSNAKLIAEANAVSTNDVVANPRRYRNLIGRLAERLEAAGQRAAEYAAVMEGVRREAKAYSEQPDVMEPCGAVAQSLQEILAGIPADTVRELKYSAWQEGFEAGWAEHENPGAFVNDVWDAKTPNPYSKEQA